MLDPEPSRISRILVSTLASTRPRIWLHRADIPVNRLEGSVSSFLRSVACCGIAMGLYCDSRPLANVR